MQGTLLKIYFAKYKSTLLRPINTDNICFYKTKTILIFSNFTIVTLYVSHILRLQHKNPHPTDEDFSLILK